MEKKTEVNKKDHLLRLFKLAKHTSNEILLEENLQNAGANSSIFLENYKRKIIQQFCNRDL